MSTCPQCGATVPKGAVYCSNCEAAINTAPKPRSISQTKTTARESALSTAFNGDLSARLEKAMRRAELLSYAAAGLGLALLAVIIVISLL